MNSTARKRAAEAASATEPPLSQPNGSEAAPSATAPQIAPQPATALDRIMDWALHRASGVTRAWLVPAGDEVYAELDRARMGEGVVEWGVRHLSGNIEIRYCERSARQLAGTAAFRTLVRRTVTTGEWTEVGE